MGADVIMITSSKDKCEDAINLGAKDVILSSDEKQIKKNINKFDLLLNTIPSDHNVTKYIQILKIPKNHGCCWISKYLYSYKIIIIW